MGKIEITLTFDELKLDALEYALRKERTTVARQMDEALRQLYEAKVPEAVREYLDSKTKPAARPRPDRRRTGHQAETPAAPTAPADK